MLAKLQNLMLFRNNFKELDELPPGLFCYLSDSTDWQPVGQVLKSTVKWTETVADYDLSTELANCFPGVPWIIDYFVSSTFPALYSHFLTEEFVQSGLNFIRSHVHDRLAPRLVGSYLMHCFLFRDRLLEIFYEHLGEPTNLPLWELFHKALIVALWSFSPRYQLTRLVQVPLVRPLSYLSITYSRSLISALYKVQCDVEQSRSVLDLFNSGIASDYPRLTEIIFYEGIIVPFTVVEAAHAFPAPSARYPLRSATAASDAFTLCVSITHVLTPVFEEPQRHSLSEHLTSRD
jgi:hypothetical protein